VAPGDSPPAFSESKEPGAAAAVRLAKDPEFAGKTIVTIACDTGERYISTLLFHQD